MSLLILLAALCDCGRPVRSLVHFRATVRSIEPIGRGELQAYAVDVDPQYILTLDIDGQPARFAIHSPARMLLDESVGKTLDFDAVKATCDGAPRGYDMLRRRLPDDLAQDFRGWLTVGERYRAEVRRDAEGQLVFVTPVKAPMHHRWHIDWTNAEQAGDANSVVFDVVSYDVSQIPNRAEWRSIYTLTVVTPARGPR